MAPSLEIDSPAPSPPTMVEGLSAYQKQVNGSKGNNITFDAVPYPFSFLPQSCALLVIDMQRDFLLTNGFGHIQAGDAGVDAVQRTIQPTLEVLKAFRACGLQVVHTREGHRSDLRNCPTTKLVRQARTPGSRHSLVIGDEGPMGRLLTKGERGHDIVDELQPLPGEIVIDKPGKGSFFSTDLHQQLVDRGVTHLIVCGVTVECCVSTTVREANDRGFDACVLSDCTDGFVPDFKSSSLNMVCFSDGLFGFVGQSTSLKSALDRYQASYSQEVPWNGSLDMNSLQAAYASGLSPSSVVKQILTRNKEIQSDHPNVWIHLANERDIYNRASHLDHHSDRKLPLYGIPFAVKDNIDVAGMPTTAACSEFSYVPTKDAAVVENLLNAGAIVIGKCNMDQFATGLVGVRTPYGVPHSKYSKDHVSGGSSSGSALAVALDLVTFSLGTDTAGSGRVPAAFNNIVGLKPTKFTVPREGVVPACKSLDCVSFFAKNIEDARTAWLVAKHHGRDSFTTLPLRQLPAPTNRSLLQADSTYTFALPGPELLAQHLCPEYYQAFEGVASAIKKLAGAREVDFDFTPYMKAASLLYKGAYLAERSGALASFFTKAENVAAVFPAVKTILDAGLQVSATEAFDDLHLVENLTRKVYEQFDLCDLLVVPTAPRHPTLKDLEVEPVKSNLVLGVFASAVNVLDLCALAVPGGWAHSGDLTLPFGITLVAPAGREGVLLEVAGRLAKLL
ncbi:aspartyl/glutamyl-tRNA(Asn/Gln) amidotransferase, A subunit [Sphaceloma murrayae]|uniref:Aspartyl/glutamyl-tRNA(Asn/Gln) amidotransferase, A subunit n=1 Tax=Sphaceloma murrayae TaxID=2082308 RepID=A0A2K1QRM4_9PEZI|nr:aspartyl/glutamyl-tRNA(Asn/Gln) amidotransferase, A subunit [Sphaceloma murrayae]